MPKDATKQGGRLRLLTGAGLAALLAGALAAGGRPALADALFSHIGGSFSESSGAFDSSRWQRSDGWKAGAHMGCGWNRANVTFGKGRLALMVDDTPAGGDRYSCGEYSTHRFYGHGAYTVSLKAVKADGVMTTVSHYTGPPFGDPWDEITLGIAGKDTTKLEISYVANGTGHRDMVIDLGFDAAKDFHSYGFDWKPDGIVWTVDGEPVHRVSGKPEELPRMPGRLMLRFWNAAGDTQWLHRFTYPDHPLTAEVTAVTFREARTNLSTNLGD
ncbi:beta-glucanase (plasmid) [Azospirillum sp. B510]|uniref:family 16 glycosylhydrolase n=1 Tax=Azospirillum sp. (strain B510) TaxID=137722 RepID=UPI0001C4BCC5|nr:family 16 glycosylhydrolase [Azospirillum sp. B510]BAI74065.1 beta-glucanase [Azospirillum sp. B510]